MQALGNAITVLGIIVTLVAYFGQHSGVSLSDLEPGLAARWNRTRGWVRRRLRRTTSVTVDVSTAWSTAAVGSPTVMSWSPIQPSDHLAQRADKLERNLDALRANVEELREHDLRHVEEVTGLLAKRITGLDQAIAARDAESRQAATAAMRWEVRGLLTTLVGAGLSIFG